MSVDRLTGGRSMGIAGGRQFPSCYGLILGLSDSLRIYTQLGAS